MGDALMAIVQDGTAQSSSNDVSGASIFTEVTVSTSGTDRRLYALIAAGGAGGAQDSQTTAVTGGGLTWTVIREARWWERTAAIWVAAAPAQLTSAVIRATVTSSINTINCVSLTVVALSGASSTPGVENYLISDGTEPIVTLAGTTAGSWALVAGCNYQTGSALTPNGSTTAYVNRNALTAYALITGRLTGTSPGGSISIGGGSAGGTGSAAVAVEILAEMITGISTIGWGML